MSAAGDRPSVRGRPSRGAASPAPFVLRVPGRHRLLVAGSILTLLALVVLGGDVFQSDGGLSDIPASVVKRGDIQVIVTESGELRAQQQSTVKATNDKMIVWLVPEGTWVEAGDELLKFETRKYEIALAGSLSNLDIAKADLEKALSDLESQKKTERAAHLEYKNLPSLAERGFINQAEVEAGRLAYEEVAARTRSYVATIAAAEAGVDQAEQAVALAQEKLGRQIVKAPRAGFVVYAEVGEPGSGKKLQLGFVPFEGQPLIHLPDTSIMNVDLEISEVDLSRVREGSPVEIWLDAYPNATFRGEVIAISRLARPKISKVTGKPTGVKIFDVSVRIEGNDERLRPGLSANARILASDYENALYVPLAGIFVDELDETIVYVRRNGRAEARPVQITDTNHRVAIIAGGLDEGEEILLGRPSEL